MITGTKRQVFYSFKYQEDVFRVQQIRNMGVIDGNPPVSVNDWETLKRQGDAAIKRWIDQQLAMRSCVIVLIGENTHLSKWVDYEIRSAWDAKKAIFGIYIHRLNCMRNGYASKGKNPFANVRLKNGRTLDNYVDCYEPNFVNAYNDISQDLNTWIETSIKKRRT